MIRICVVICVHDDHHFLSASIASFRKLGPVFVFVTVRSWVAPDGPWQRSQAAAEQAGATVIVGDWGDESSHRSYALRYVAELGYTHAAIPDGDEVIEESLAEALIVVAEARLAERISVNRDTYWRTSEWVIRPREPYKPVTLVDIAATYHVGWRDFRGGRELILGPEQGLVHHLSYAGPPERISRKLQSWRQPDPQVPNWQDSVWNAWNERIWMRDIHPTHPESYGCAEPIRSPSILSGISPEVYGYPPRGDFRGHGTNGGWSVVIPLYGGEHYICECLNSLTECGDLVDEIIVVDNGSPDDAASIAEMYPKVNLIRSPENRGFAWACNRGFEATRSDAVLFLNSDTISFPQALGRLQEALYSASDIAMVGPLSNYAGYEQSINPTFSGLSNLREFVKAMAGSASPDKEVDMLVGFCLGTRRSFLEGVGGFDTRFTLGLWEDNDLSYRARRAGQRLLVCQRSFVYHFGSSSFPRAAVDFNELFNKNRDLFVQKWAGDLDSGFATGLSGLSAGPITFSRP